MAKIQESEIHCELLKEAYQRAQRSAFANLSGIPSGVKWDYDTYGNQISTKGGTVSKDTCSECGKHITVTFNFPKIAATNWETGQPVNLYDTIGGTESISVSGHRCTEDEHQK